MICRQCGTEIADKALICYRCGTPTTEAKFKPAAPARRLPRLLIVVLVAVILIALTTAYVAFGRGAQAGATSGIVVAVALLVVVARAVLRRR